MDIQLKIPTLPRTLKLIKTKNLRR